MPATAVPSRAEVLADCGARPDDVDALLAYGAGTPRPDALPDVLPLPDEPLADAWRGYVEEARRDGTMPVLRRHLMACRFPVQAGLSETDAYRRATRRGDWEAAAAFAPGLQLQHEAGVSLDLRETMGGAVPVIAVSERADFVTLVQALTTRNEPTPVPDSMGACLIRGLNNWSRIDAHRRAWEAAAHGPDETWDAEFRRLVPQKAQYQDRLVLLSRGAYSAVPASAIGLDEDEWLDASLVIRREHELVHNFTSRCLGVLRTHVVDELVADFIGLIHARGRYEAALARRFLGLEAYPHWRADGRLENYRPPDVTDDAMSVLRTLAFRATAQLEAIASTLAPTADDLRGLARMTIGLVTLSLEELASDGAVGRLQESLG